MYVKGAMRPAVQNFATPVVGWKGAGDMGNGNHKDERKPVIIIINNHDRGRWRGGGWGYGRVGYFFWIMRRLAGFLFFGLVVVFIVIALTKPQIIYGWFLSLLGKIGLRGAWDQLRRFL
jgi:hypothetical protein